MTDKLLNKNKKKWFRGWHYYYSPGTKLTFYIPNSATFKQLTLTNKDLKEEKLEKVFDLLASAFDQIERDNKPKERGTTP